MLASTPSAVRASAPRLRGPFIPGKRVVLFVALEALGLSLLCWGLQNTPWTAFHEGLLFLGFIVAGSIAILALVCMVILDVAGFIVRRRT